MLFYIHTYLLVSALFVRFVSARFLYPHHCHQCPFLAHPFQHGSGMAVVVIKFFILYIYYSDNQADRCPLVLTGTFGVDAEVSRGRACARSLGIMQV